MWTAWPSHAELWGENLEDARAAVGAMVHALAIGEPVEVLAADDRAAADAGLALAGANATVRRADFGDIWLRDTGAIVLVDDVGHRRAVGFRFNGWGGKYVLEGDNGVAAAMANAIDLSYRGHDWVLEGGAIEADGTGWIITTEQCLLNPNRNPELTREAIEQRLMIDLGGTRVLWLGQGLVGDHTDGHVDNLVRFVAPGRLAIPVADHADDPNAATYTDATVRARAAGLAVVPLPSPGRVEVDGGLVAASYMNFVIGNAAVVVPTYGRPNDQAAVAAIAALFPDRRAVGIRADALLTGGGSFHCITQQVPA